VNDSLDLNELDEEQLLRSIEQALASEELGAAPLSPQQLRKKAREYANAIREKSASAICNNKTIRDLASGGVTGQLVAAVAGVIEALTIRSAVTPLAMLLCKEGLSRLCANTWIDK
jgi:hypothetical protein